jgi:hypothetical protein
MPFKMRWLSTLGLPWLFGKNDRRRQDSETNLKYSPEAH